MFLGWLSLHLKQKAVESDSYLLILYIKDLKKVSQNRFSVNKKQERVVLHILWHDSQCIKYSEYFEELGVLEELTVLDQFTNLIVGHWDHYCFHRLPPLRFFH